MYTAGKCAVSLPDRPGRCWMIATRAANAPNDNAAVVCSRWNFASSNQRLKCNFSSRNLKYLFPFFHMIVSNSLRDSERNASLIVIETVDNTLITKSNRISIISIYMSADKSSLFFPRTRYNAAFEKATQNTDRGWAQADNRRIEWWMPFRKLNKLSCQGWAVE